MFIDWGESLQEDVTIRSLHINALEYVNRASLRRQSSTHYPYRPSRVVKLKREQLGVVLGSILVLTCNRVTLIHVKRTWTEIQYLQ